MESVFVKMWIYVQVWCGSWVRLDCVDFPKLRLPVCGCWVCMRSVNVSVFLHNRKYIAWDCSVVSEPHCSHAQPWRVGHEGKAVPHRGRDQDVGHCLLRHTEAVSRRNPQVRSCANIFFFSSQWSPLQVLLSHCEYGGDAQSHHSAVYL